MSDNPRFQRCRLIFLKMSDNLSLLKVSASMFHRWFQRCQPISCSCCERFHGRAGRLWTTTQRHRKPPSPQIGEFKIWTNMFLKTQKTSCNPSSSPSLSQFSQIHKINTDLHSIPVFSPQYKTQNLLVSCPEQLNR